MILNSYFWIVEDAPIATLCYKDDVITFAEVYIY